jgi:hypothetical protein
MNTLPGGKTKMGFAGKARFGKTRLRCLQYGFCGATGGCTGRGVGGVWSGLYGGVTEGVTPPPPQQKKTVAGGCVACVMLHISKVKRPWLRPTEAARSVKYNAFDETPVKCAQWDGGELGWRDLGFVSSLFQTFNKGGSACGQISCILPRGLLVSGFWFREFCDGPMEMGTIAHII